jgi:N-acetylglucosamine kinase-like BadF-type ATPase
MGLAAQQGLVVAVDGGGSKTDVLVVALDGTIVGRARAGGSVPHTVGVPRSAQIIGAAVVSALGDADPAAVALAGIYLSGIDLPPEAVAYKEAIAGLAWTGPDTIVDNDLFAALRAGTLSPDALAIVCGTGINGMGVRADGATARFAALGPISGDWGGGSGLGESALWHAARAEDGRGPQTMLRDAVLAGMGVGSVAELIEDLHFGRRSSAELATLSPAVFSAATDGDEIAASLVDRLADEIVSYARAMVDRLGLEGRKVPLVLGGAVLRAGDARLLAGIEHGLASLPCTLEVVRPRIAPVVGAALLTLEAAGAPQAALERLLSQAAGQSEA